MSDPLNELERSLQQFTPAPPSERLEARIAAALRRTPVEPSSRLSLAHRCLAATISAGLIAACVSITLLTLDFTGGRAPSPGATPTAQGDSPTVRDTQRLLAQLMSNDAPDPRRTGHTPLESDNQ